MRRAQRRVHAFAWPLIGLVMAATLIAALLVREHPAPLSTTPAAEVR